MFKDNAVEKRISPRIKKALSLLIKSDDADFVTETKDISYTGAYCHVDRNIKLLIRLSIHMNLPDGEEIRCHGVVVRVEEAVPTGYNIAIFFNEIDDDNREKLARFINQHVSHKFR